MADRKDKREKGDGDKKALSWRERLDPEIAGRRWDSDVREGFGKWKGDK